MAPLSLTSRPSWPAFVAWAVVGAGCSLGVLSILSIGPVVLAVTSVAALGLMCWRKGWAGLPSLVRGLAMPLLYVAYLNKDGPGTICTSDARGSSCSDQWSPWPFIAVGMLLLAAGSMVFVVLRRQFR